MAALSLASASPAANHPRTVWAEILDKLDRLRALDRRFQAFGAETHRYALRPRASESTVAAAERKLGVSLPDDLRRFYTEVADGGAGPHYGLLPAASLRNPLKAAAPFPGAAALRALDPDAGRDPSYPDYFEAPHEAIAGLLPIIEEGCGHRVCLVATPAPDGAGVPCGAVVYVSCDGYVVETRQSLADLYHEWLDRELTHFHAVRDLMAAGKSLDEIEAELRDRHHCHFAADYVSSIADVAKPGSLFGTRGARTYHWAKQKPWFEQVLRAWQARHAPRAEP